MGACFSDQTAGKAAAGGTAGPDEKAEGGREEENSGESLAHMKGLKGLSSHLELSLSCKGVRSKESLRKGDPMAVLMVKNETGDWEELGRTEIIHQTGDPQWVTQLRVLYKFETQQELRFCIYDTYETNDETDLETRAMAEFSPSDMVAEAECLMVQIITAKHQTLLLPLSSPDPNTSPAHPDAPSSSSSASSFGTLTIKAEELTLIHAMVKIDARGKDLDRKDMIFFRSDPFLIISRLREDDTWAPVFKTEVLLNDLNPKWQTITITLQQLCNGDMERPLKIECFDFDMNGRHDLIGTTETTVEELQCLPELQTGKPLIRKKQKDPTNPKAGGHLFIDRCDVIPRHTFLDYVFGGCEIGFMVAIDFTASNGDPNIPGTLHYVNPDGTLNKYQQVIESVGEIVKFYDYDSKFPAWGFGGKLPDDVVSHCFALNGNEFDPEVEGVQGILDSYMSCLKTVGLAGPTLFTPVIKAASNIATQFVSQKRQKYFCLLILTDGIITDLDATVGALVDASGLPLSVLIFGIGEADFTRMNILDANKKRLVSVEGTKALRDNVGFYPMQDFKSDEEIARKMLAELPLQLLEFMDAKKIFPNKQILEPEGEEEDEITDQGEGGVVKPKKKKLVVQF